ncbi:MAG: exosome complex RNA-binding protein Rrp4 [Nanoarchaeota archaeon]
MGLLVKERDVAIPGDELAEGMDNLPAQGSYRDGDKIIANQLGVVTIQGRLIRIVPLRGRYEAKAGDLVIGKVVNIGFSSWSIDISTAYDAQISLKEGTSDYVERGSDLTQYYDFGDLVVAKITNVSTGKLVDLTMKGPGLRKLVGGRTLIVASSKVPRIIGKQGSMITMIKDYTGCRISVGQNGIVWLSGSDNKSEALAIEAIELIQKEAHTEGLTERIKELLEKNKK